VRHFFKRSPIYGFLDIFKTLWGRFGDKKEANNGIKLYNRG
jgi:hypothetical protein